MRYLLVLLVLVGCGTPPGQPNACVSESMTEGREFTLKGKPYQVVRTFGSHENCREAARPIAAEIRERIDPLTAAGVSNAAAQAVSDGISQEVLDPSGLTASDTAQILKK